MNTVDQRQQLENYFANLHHWTVRNQQLCDAREAIIRIYGHLYLTMLKPWGIWRGVLLAMIYVVVLSTLGSFVRRAWSGVPYNEWPELVRNSAVLLVVAAPFLAWATVEVRNWLAKRTNARREQLNLEKAADVHAAAKPQTDPLDEQLFEPQQEFDARFRGTFPDRYLNPADVGACWNLVANHRANTVPDAINQMLQDRHRDYVEANAGPQIRSQQPATTGFGLPTGLGNARARSRAMRTTAFTGSILGKLLRNR